MSDEYDWEQDLLLDLSEHTKENVYERLERLTTMCIQDLPEDIKNKLYDILYLELGIQEQRLRLQAAGLKDYVGEQIAKANRDNIKNINK